MPYTSFIKISHLNRVVSTGEAANQAINQNRGDFLKAAKPHLEKTVTKLLLETANKVVDGLTLDQLLPKP